MSYILDALTKSQRERDQANVPSLETDYGPIATRQKTTGHWPQVSLGVAVVAVAIAAYALWSRPPEVSRSVAQMPPTSVASESAEPTQAAAVPTESRIVPPVFSPPRATPAQIPNAPASSASPAVPVVTRDADALAEQILERRRERASRGGGRPEPMPNASVAVSGLPQSEASVPLEPTAESGASPALVALAPASAEPAPAPVRDSVERAPSLRSLPSEVRSNIPALRINAHVYASEPAERMVIINMRRYGEKETTKEGPIIDAITPAGAVLSHAGHRFALPLP